MCVSATVPPVPMATTSVIYICWDFTTRMWHFSFQPFKVPRRSIYPDSQHGALNCKHGPAVLQEMGLNKVTSSYFVSQISKTGQPLLILFYWGNCGGEGTPLWLRKELPHECSLACARSSINEIFILIYQYGVCLPAHLWKLHLAWKCHILSPKLLKSVSRPE